MSKVTIVKNNLPLAANAIEQGLKEGLKKVAMTLERAIKLKITSNIPPPLAPETIARKGSSVALIDTGLLRSQIAADYGHIEEKKVVIGVLGSRAGIGAIHEFGAPRAGIPERSFLRSSLEEVKPTIPALFKIPVIIALDQITK